MALRKAILRNHSGSAQADIIVHPVKDCRPAHLNRRDLAVERISGIIREIERQPPVMLFSGGHEVRYIRLNQPHPAQVKPFCMRQSLEDILSGQGQSLIHVSARSGETCRHQFHSESRPQCQLT
jgi:hypothetical protein